MSNFVLLKMSDFVHLIKESIEFLDPIGAGLD